MPVYKIDIHHPGRTHLLLLLSFASIAVIFAPVFYLTQDIVITLLTLFGLVLAAIWFYNNACTSEAEWETGEEGMAISVKPKSKYFPFEDVFIRWEDITGYRESCRIRYIGPDYHYFELSIYTFPGNDLVLYAPYESEELKMFMDQFRRYVAEKSRNNPGS